MKIIAEKYRALKPEIEYLADEVVIAQAWKKTHGYIRKFNWYADPLALDISALGIESNAKNWAKQIWNDEPLYPIELVPAAKSEPWGINPINGWVPEKESNIREKKPPLRPLAHITIRDQTWATAAMLCLADAIETAQGDCSAKNQDFKSAQKNKIYSYGNRLLCDWKEDKAWFRWGNGETYRKFFTDYQNFLKRPIEIGRSIVEHHTDAEHVYVINLDLSKFFDNIDRSLLIERLKSLSEEFGNTICTDFWESFTRITDWKWRDEDVKIAQNLSLNLGNGLPQGLVASGFFSNAYLINFDRAFGKKIGKKLSSKSDIILHDYCRYVDDLRLVISSAELSIHQINKEINKWTKKLLEHNAGQRMEVNENKTRVISLASLDNSGSIAGRLEMLQGDLSGPADRDILDGAIGVLESLLLIENEKLFDLKDIKHKDYNLFQLSEFDHDIRPDTLKRFAANRLENIMRSKRKIDYINDDPKYNHILMRSENESELLARKLIVAWMKDPSLALVLRKAIEIYPSQDLFEPVFAAIFIRSSFGDVVEDNITAAFMDYLLSDLFRCANDFNGFFQYVTYPSTVEPREILELTAHYAQKVVASEKALLFVERQALLLLATLNKPIFNGKKSNNIQHTLHSILVNSIPVFNNQSNALFEIAAQITGNFNTYASSFLDYMSDISYDKQYKALEEFAKRGGPFWLSLWKQINKRRGFENLSKVLIWASQITVSNPKPVQQKLSKVIASDSNGFEHEAALIKLALGLIELSEESKEIISKSPYDIKISILSKTEKIGWDRIWHPNVTGIKCILDSSQNFNDPRFDIPDWIENTGIDSLFQVELIYWIGTILRASALGGCDFTGNRWKKSNTTTYKGLRTSWYKRRMGMMHTPENIVGEYATITDWFSELLMRCLQWPGFESSFVQYKDIRSIVDLATLKLTLKLRLNLLDSMFCKSSDIPTLITKVNRPKLNRNRGFRIVTIQPLLPRTTDFNFSDPLLNNPPIRARHREHLMAVCQLVYKTLAAKLIADQDELKPAADLIVFPELSVHVDDQDVIKRLADKTQSMIFAGLVFLDNDGKQINTARWFIPHYRDTGRQWIIRDQGKAFMTEAEEKLNISGFRPCQHIINVHGSEDGPFRISGAICYDATDIRLATDLRDKTDLFIVVAHNQDVNTFDNMAAALHYHMYQHVVITNIGEFGGSTIQAPFKEHYHRLISHVHGSEQISINMADIDLAAFRRNTSKNKKVKTKPAGI